MVRKAVLKDVNGSAESTSGGQRARTSQRDLPKLTLEECLRIPRAIIDNYAGDPTPPHQVAIALDVSPTSSAWRVLTGAAIGYGLTDGGYASTTISPTSLARRILEPTSENEDKDATRESVMAPTIPNKFFSKYLNSKFPKDDIAKNVLKSLGVPREQVDECLNIIRKNGEYASIIVETKTGPFVSATAARRSEITELGDNYEEPTPESDNDIAKFSRIAQPGISVAPENKVEPATKSERNSKVFITHGRNTAIVQQLKEILQYGKFEPVVAVEHETPSQPIPEKVLGDMRKCFAGIIHVENEETVLDKKGKERHFLNQNVLVEIGAAMALFEGRFILLVQKGVELPSNLQGLYRCEYEGNALDFDSTMKLLKAFNEFR